MIDDTLDAFLERIGPFPARTVSVVGIGPGDAGLITVKGALRLWAADVAVHSGTYCPPAIWNLLKDDAERILVGPAPGRPTPTPAEIAELMRPHIEAGRRVVRLKSGDPFIFARAEQEIRALAQAGIGLEIVPCSTSAIAAAAYSGVPLTERQSSDAVSLVIGQADRDPGVPEPDLAAMARSGTLAVYLGEQDPEKLCRELLAAGLAGTTPVSVVEHATRPSHRVVSGTIDTVSARAVEMGIERPAIVFVGPAATSQPQMRWFDRRPLFGQRVLVTRPWRQSAVLAGPLTTLGAEVIEAPTVAIEPLPDYAAVDRALGGLPGYDWLVLTSANGVNAAAKRLRHLGLDARSLASVRIAAIGPATAARLRELFIEPDLVPEEFVAEALAESMGATDLKGKRCLLLRSDIARRTLCDLLIEAGADCDDICAYRTTRPDSLPEQVIRDLEAGVIHWATFTSSSSFSSFADLLGTGAAAILPTLKLASIGPVTSKTIRSAGYEPTVEAKVYTVEGLADAIAGHLAEARGQEPFA